ELTVERLGTDEGGEWPARVDPAVEWHRCRRAADRVGQDSGEAGIPSAGDEPRAEVEAGVRRAFGLFDDHEGHGRAAPGAGPRARQLPDRLIGDRWRWRSRAGALAAGDHDEEGQPEHESAWMS